MPFPENTGLNPVGSMTIPCWVIHLTLLSQTVFGHEALYHTAEIHLTDPAVVAVHFSVHAPELLLDPDTDFSDIGDEWLAGRSDQEITDLIEKSRRFVEDSYTVRSDKWNALSVFPLTFESPELIRTPNREGGPRPGCILASLSFPNPGGELEFFYSENAGKRLLFVEIKPQAFPKTHDLEPGSFRKLTLPDPPPKPWWRENWVFLIVTPLSFFLIAAVFLLAIK